MNDKEILKVAQEYFNGLFDEQGNVIMPNGVKVRHKDNLVKFAKACWKEGRLDKFMMPLVE